MIFLPGAQIFCQCDGRKDGWIRGSKSLENDMHAEQYVEEGLCIYNTMALLLYSITLLA